ncbi:MAG: PEGA domain-containing protein, partial [Myxococcales bacterium]|nr:PEGA domain-containing protein [Myxococcales bacterium]
YAAHGQQPAYAAHPHAQQQQAAYAQTAYAPAGHTFAPTPPQGHAAVRPSAPNLQTWPPTNNAPAQVAAAAPPWQPLAPPGSFAVGNAISSPEQLGLESDEQRARRRRRRAVMAAMVSVLLLASAGAIVLFAFWPFDRGEATIDVVSVPLGGEIWLDGKNTGLKTQASVVVDPNKPHVVEVRLLNYKTDRKTVRFPDGQNQVRVVALLTANYGKLDVNSKPEGADVIVNGERRGNTPLVIEGLSLRENINLELRMRGFKPVTRKLEWDQRTFIKQVITLRRTR